MKLHFINGLSPLGKSDSWKQLFLKLYKNHKTYFGFGALLKLLQNAVFKKLPFCCPLVNFGPLSREQVHSPDVNNCVLSVWLKRQREPRDWVGSVSPAVRLMGFKLVTSIHSQRFNSLGQPQPPLPPTLYAEVPNVRFNRLGVVFSCYERERTKNGSFAVIFPQLWSV